MSVQDKGSTILISKELYDDFISFFPKLKAEILTHWTSRKLPHFAIAYYNELMCETVFRGKHMRAQLFLLATHYIFEEVSGESKESFLGLAWIFEILQTASIIGDDITDNSTMRRGQKCWHLNDHVKLIAVNDMVLLENICFFLLKKYFSTHPQYLNLVEAFHDSTLRLCIGQGLDLLAENSIHPERFNMTLYEEIVNQKTAHFGFCLPLTSALILSGTSHGPLFDQIERIALKIGIMFQIHDDFIDIYGDPLKTGKVSTDITNGKCAWPVVAALELSNSTQRMALLENYGQKNYSNVRVVKDVFSELGIREHFKKCIAFLKESTDEDICAITTPAIREMFSTVNLGIVSKILDAKLIL